MLVSGFGTSINKVVSTINENHYARVVIDQAITFSCDVASISSHDSVQHSADNPQQTGAFGELKNRASATM